MPPSSGRKEAFQTRTVHHLHIEEELKKLRTEVHHIGNNINQIARSANAGFAKPEDIRQALFLMDKVYTLFYNYFHS